MSDWLSMFDDSLEVAPPLGEEQLARIPARRGVLALVGQGDLPILLLTAADIRSRLRVRLAEPPEEGRRKTADLREVTRKVLWRLSPGHFETDLNYFDFARAIWPKSYSDLLSWKKPWFIRVDPGEQFPHFARTREPDYNGLCVGPFPSGAWAQKFIEALEDAFDLCRDVACLRMSPNGQPCSYLQMGRCLGPCNGTIPMADYRTHVAAAAQFASGQREEHLQQLRANMKQAAADLKFEQAATIKSRIERLAFFDSEPFAFAAPLEEFRFMLIGQGAKRSQASLFMVQGAAVVKGECISYPIIEQQLSERLGQMSALAKQQPPAIDEVGLWRMGLVSHYLFSGGPKGGLAVRWRADLRAAGLAAAIDAAAGNLRLGKHAFKPQTHPEPPVNP